MKQHPINNVYLTRIAGAEVAGVPKKCREIRTLRIKMKQHPINNVYLTRTAGAEGTEVPKKGPEIRTHGIR